MTDRSEFSDREILVTGEDVVGRIRIHVGIVVLCIGRNVTDGDGSEWEDESRQLGDGDGVRGA